MFGHNSLSNMSLSKNTDVFLKMILIGTVTKGDQRIKEATVSVARTDSSGHNTQG